MIWKKMTLPGPWFRALCLLAFASLCASESRASGAEAGQASAALRRRLEQAAAADLGGDSRAANAIYLKTTTDYPDSAEAWSALGEHLRFYIHDSQAAEAAFEKALKAPQQDANAAAFAWRGLGELASKENRAEAAIAYFKKSLDALPLADTHRSLCHLYCRQKDFKAAAAQAREAVKLNPDDPIALLLYAAQLHRAGQPAEGRRQYERALSAGGMDAKGHAAGTVHCCIIYNASGYLGVCGEKEAALKMLQRFFETPNHRHLSRAEIESDADFETLKNTPGFRTLLDTYFSASPPAK